MQITWAWSFDSVGDLASIPPMSALETRATLPLLLSLNAGDTRLQNRGDAVNHRAGRHDQLHTIVDLGVDRSIAEIDQLRRTSCKLTTLPDIAI
jgi:hypothetical protein